jgi:hypothetical protein
MLMVVIGVLAADLPYWREEGYTLLPPVGSKQPFLWQILPLINAVVIGLLALAGQVIRRGECRPFLFGFVVCGGLLAATLYALYPAFQGVFDPPLRFTKDVLDRLLRASGLITHLGDYYTPFWHDFAMPALVIAVISPPPFLAALLGGWLFRRYGVTIVRRPPIDGVSDRRRNSSDRTPVPEGRSDA